MKSLFFMFLIVLLATEIFSQDVVEKRNGEKIFGKIMKDDSLKLIIRTFPDGFETNTEIEKYNIKGIIYNYKKSDERFIKYNKPESDTLVKKYIDEDRNAAITVGFLNGGGSLIGFDLEILFAKRIGLQLGGGIIGYGAGINIHFLPRINSSFISIQYLNQGVGSGFVQSVLGPSIGFRAKKIIALQFGFGYVLERGPAYPKNVETSPVILTYSIGCFFPLKAN